MRPCLLVLLFLALATPALASDGVLEINQTCAVQTGCFAGDTPGYPVTITTSGSYRLTSNLTGIGANVDGIFLTTSRITIDFNGFSLWGPSLGSGTGNGIAGSGTDGSFAGFTTIKNGVIRGFRAKGVALAGARGVRIEDMTIEFAAGGGAQVGEEARIVGNGFSNNGITSPLSNGLTAGTGSFIAENTVSESGGDGIFAGGGSTISSNTAYQNADEGITSGNGSTISGNTVYLNGGRGIEAEFGSTVSKNTAYQNGDDGIFVRDGSTISSNTARSNTGDGIQVGLGSQGNAGSLVINNSATDNGESGIYAAVGSRIDGNHVSENGDHGIEVEFFGALVIRNSARANTNGNYSMFSGSAVGVIVTPPLSPAISGNGPGVGVGTTDPWANFAY